MMSNLSNEAWHRNEIAVKGKKKVRTTEKCQRVAEPLAKKTTEHRKRTWRVEIKRWRKQTEYV